MNIPPIFELVYMQDDVGQRVTGRVQDFPPFKAAGGGFLRMTL